MTTISPNWSVFFRRANEYQVGDRRSKYSVTFVVLAMFILSGSRVYDRVLTVLLKVQSLEAAGKNGVDMRPGALGAIKQMSDVGSAIS
jgi:hypothetical protein